MMKNNNNTQCGDDGGQAGKNEIKMYARNVINVSSSHITLKKYAERKINKFLTLTMTYFQYYYFTVETTTTTSSITGGDDGSDGI